MKRFAFTPSLILGFALLSVALAGCGQKPATAPNTPPPPAVRGQKIGSLTAEPSTPSATNQTAPASASTAKTAEVTAKAPPAPVAAAKTNDKPAEAQDEYTAVGFDKLSAFNYEMPDESKGPITNAPPTAAKDQIPKEIRAFNKKKIALQGFMLPLKVENGLITELLIMRDQSMCCYGNVPRINEWVSVRMTTKGVKPIMDQTVTLYGVLKVGEMRENGYLVGIYEMEGERMAGPLDL